MEKWSLEKVWAWYNSLPWIRGCCYYPSIAVNRIELWQEYNWEEMKACMDKELALVEEWGFNTLRISMALELYIAQKESCLKHLDEFLELCEKYHLQIIFTFMSDCSVPKKLYSAPTFGPQSFDLGYHSGKKISPNIVIDEPGYILLDDIEYREKYYQMVHDIVSKYKEDKRIIIWDICNEPGNGMRDMRSISYIKKTFKIVRSYNPIQPCGTGCWSYKDNKPFQQIELETMEMSDVILYHCYMKNEDCIAVTEYLKEKYNRPLINSEWLHRIWHNDVDVLFPYFRKNKIGCLNWGFIAGKTQTYLPWEWLFNEYDKGNGRDWDFTKWQHDLVRANYRPYDFKEYEIIKNECRIADEEFKNKK